MFGVLQKYQYIQDAPERQSIPQRCLNKEPGGKRTLNLLPLVSLWLDLGEVFCYNIYYFCRGIFGHRCR